MEDGVCCVLFVYYDKFSFTEFHSVQDLGKLYFDCDGKNAYIQNLSNYRFVSCKKKIIGKRLYH